MSWAYRWHHVSQLHSDGSGHNACAEASLARYLLEVYPDLGTTGEWALVGQVRDQAAPQTVWDLIDRLSVIGRGVHDVAGAPPTTADGIDAILVAFGIKAVRDYSPGAYDAAYAAPWGLLNVDACALSPAQYPQSWLGGECGQANHLILWLPNQGGQANWFDDPLAANDKDCQYGLASIKAATYGCWVLPAPPAPRPKPAPSYVTAQRASLKPTPDHVSTALVDVPAGTRVVPVDTTGWELVLLPDGKAGWLLQSNLRQA